MNLSELTLQFENIIFYFNAELCDYLKMLKGINDVVLEENNNRINIWYNKSLIGTKTIFLEVTYFLGIQKNPPLISFDKHSSKKLNKYTLVIPDACCEFCLEGMLIELLFMEGIEQATCNSYEEFWNVPIDILYDSSIISVEDLKNLKLGFYKYEK